MRRTPLFTAILWTTAGGVGCGDPPPAIIDASIIDGATVDSLTVDGPVDAPALQLTFPSTLTMSAECGGVTTGAELSIHNDGATAVIIENVNTTGGFAVFLDGPISIDAGATTSIHVEPPAAVIGTDLGGSVKTGTLTLATDRGTSSPVALTSTIMGANLALADSAGQPLSNLVLGGTSTCPAPGVVTVRNSGNVAVTVGVSAGSAPAFQWSGLSPSSVIEPGTSAVHDVRALTFGPCAVESSLLYDVTGPVCTTTPIVLTASFSIVGSSSCFCS